MVASLNQRVASLSEIESKLKTAELEIEKLRVEKDTLENKAFEKDLAVFFDQNQSENTENGNIFFQMKSSKFYEFRV